MLKYSSIFQLISVYKNNGRWCLSRKQCQTAFNANRKMSYSSPQCVLVVGEGERSFFSFMISQMLKHDTLVIFNDDVIKALLWVSYKAIDCVSNCWLTNLLLMQRGEPPQLETTAVWSHIRKQQKGLVCFLDCSRFSFLSVANWKLQFQENSLSFDLKGNCRCRS